MQENRLLPSILITHCIQEDVTFIHIYLQFCKQPVECTLLLLVEAMERVIFSSNILSLPPLP